MKSEPIRALDALRIDAAPRHDRLMLSGEISPDDRDNAYRGKVTCCKSKMRRRTTQAEAPPFRAVSQCYRTLPILRRELP